MKPIIIKIIKLFVSLALISFLVSKIDWQQIEKLNYFSVIILVIGIIFTLIIFIFMSLRWKLLLDIQTRSHISMLKAYSFYLIGSTFSVIMPGAIGGDLMRMKLSSNHCRISLKKAAHVVFLERLFGLASIFILLLSGIILSPSLPFEVINNKLWGFSILMIFIISSSYWVLNHTNINLKLILPLLALSILPQLSDAIILHICCIYFDVNVVFENLLIIMPLVFIATVIPISFGGLGVREASLIGLLSLFTPFSSKLIIISFILTSIKLCVGVIGIPFYLQKSE